MAEGESRESKDRPYWLPVVIAFVMWAWLTYLYLYPDAVEKTQFSFNTWKNIVYLVIVIMLAWLFIWKITLSTDVAVEAEEAAAEPAPKKAKEEAPASTKEPAKKRPKRVVVKAPAATAVAAKAATRKVEEVEEEEDLLPDDEPTEEEEEEPELEDLPRVIEWEKKEPGGVYSDTLVRVDENLILNLRTLLGKVCHNCEELDDCKRRVAGKLDEDVFLSNFECKEGLKGELQRARKRRELEEEKATAAKEMVDEKAAGSRKTVTKKKTAKKKAVESE